MEDAIVMGLGRMQSSADAQLGCLGRVSSAQRWRNRCFIGGGDATIRRDTDREWKRNRAEKNKVAVRAGGRLGSGCGGDEGDEWEKPPNGLVMVIGGRKVVAVVDMKRKMGAVDGKWSGDGGEEEKAEVGLDGRVSGWSIGCER